ncbi:DUF6352 family protein [Ideonella sp. A 288]|uniref:DUF6352 family protein n=1 Tax=Ideonella sp. A 288 TaxID=1962181 RepID=UPI000B4BE18A|nr:DUF6352 family protein [Ideonella sp. A 288]
MQDFWPDCGHRHLQRTAGGWLVPGDDYLRWLLARPELALVPESCAAEIALHRALQASPRQPVTDASLAALADADARDNWRLFIAFRDTLLAAGTLEAWLLTLFRSGQVNVPPPLIDAVVQAVLRELLDDCGDALQARAAELLFRHQRVSVHEGRLLAGDRDTLDLLDQTNGLGEIGRLLKQAQAPLKAVQLQVLGADNGVEYWADRRHRFLLDLTHEVAMPLAEGLSVRLSRTDSALSALARVLERWVAHLLGVAVRIEPRQRIDDTQWRWHLGLDAESTALLNALYLDQPVDEAQLARLVSLFELRFERTAEMRPDVAGKPVWLGLAMNADGVLRLKPQNLLLNLPLATTT